MSLFCKMFCRIFLCIIILETLAGVTESNHDNGLNTITLKNHKTTAKQQRIAPLRNGRLRKVNKKMSSSTTENIFQSWGLLILDSNTNKLLEDEHDQLKNDFQKKKMETKALPILLESIEVDDDRNKLLRQKVETWYGNLQSRRKLGNLEVSPDMGDIVRCRRNLQSTLGALSRNTQLSERLRSHTVDYRKQSGWRKQLLNQYSMPQAVDYRRLLTLWQKELRRQLQIKWNRRPLVEISPGAFKTDIYVNPPDDLANRMQKLLALKKRQEERKKDLNAGNENA